MKINIAIRIDEEFVRELDFESQTLVPIPNVGEFVVNPRTDGLVVEVKQRIFEYRKNCVYVTLEC